MQTKQFSVSGARAELGARVGRFFHEMFSMKSGSELSQFLRSFSNSL